MTYSPHVFSGAYRRGNMTSNFTLAADQSVTAKAVLVPTVEQSLTSRTYCTLTISVNYSGTRMIQRTVKLNNVAPNPCAGKTCGCGTLPACKPVDPCAGKTCGCGKLPACVVNAKIKIPTTFSQEGASTTDVTKLTTETAKKS